MVNHPNRSQVARVYDHDGWKVGDRGVLVLYSPQQGPARRWLQPEPPLTNQSREPRVQGWCGTTNNVSCDAYGWYRVTAILDFVRDDPMVRSVSIERVTDAE